MRVAIAEDSGIFRQALVTLLRAVDVDVVGAFATGEELLGFVEERAHDLDSVIIDLHMPPTFTDEGAVAARRIRRLHPRLGVLILSAYNETPQAVALFEKSHGGVGYLLKDNVTDVATLRECLRRLNAGEVVIDPMVVTRLVSARHTSDDISVLSVRERDVLSLMAQGYSNAGIAHRLSLSPRTAEDHVRAIFLKLDLGPEKTGLPEFDVNKRVLAILTWLRAAHLME